jgi:hypothetical protein
MNTHMTKQADSINTLLFLVIYNHKSWDNRENEEEEEEEEEVLALLERLRTVIQLIKKMIV